MPYHDLCLVWLCVCMYAKIANSVPDARTWMHSSVTVKPAQCSYVVRKRNCILCTWCTGLHDDMCPADVTHIDNRFACPLLEQATCKASDGCCNDCSKVVTVYFQHCCTKWQNIAKPSCATILHIMTVDSQNTVLAIDCQSIIVTLHWAIIVSLS